MKKILCLMVLAAMTALYLTFDSHLTDRFQRIMKAYEDSLAVNLDASLSADDLQRVLFTNAYVPTLEDARFVAAFLTSRFRGDTLPESIPGLGGGAFRLPAALVETAGTGTYRKMLADNYLASGWDGAASRMDADVSLPSVAVLADTLRGSIRVRVQHRVPADKLPGWKSFFGLDKVPAQGILVRLEGHTMGEGHTQLSRTLAYARTDRDGHARFEGLDPMGSYSVIPVHRDMTFGVAKGTSKGSLHLQNEGDRLDFSFVSAERTVKAFTAASLLRMRQDGCVTVRTPQAYHRTLRGCVTLFLAVWALVFLIGRTGRRKMDTTLAVLLMGMSFIGMMVQFIIHDALTGRLMGVQMAQGAIAGAGGIALMLMVDWLRFYRCGYAVGFNFLFSLLASPFRAVAWLVGRGSEKRRSGNYLSATSWPHRVGETLASLPGSGYLLVAVLLTAALFVFGQSVGGMKVNLYLGMPVQPSEIVKFLLVIFMAAFFARNCDRLVGYSTPVWVGGQVSAGTLLLRKVKVMAAMLGSLGLFILMYMLLGDLGPAIIISLTFITLYSLIKSRIETGHALADWDEVCRCDLARLLVGVVTFAGAVLLGTWLDAAGFPKLRLGVDIGYRALSSGLWFVLWLLRGWKRKNIDESAVMFNIIVVAFLYGSSWLGALGLTDAAERLETRTAVCSNTFGTLDTEGDGSLPAVNGQTALGLWALAAGGPLGQGFQAQASEIPAFHTDFILQSIGLIGGLASLLAVFVLYALIGWRGLLAGYNSKNRFLLFLCCGVTLVTAVQIAVVAGGTLSLVPMTGLTAPWLSYGRISVFFHLLAWGIVLTVSARDAGPRANHNRPYGHTLALLSLIAAFFMGIIILTLCRYMTVGRDTTLNRPLFVTNAQGLNVIEPNPFIRAAVRSMRSGDVYDRNGVLLATSSPERLADPAQTAAYRRAGLTGVDSLSHLIRERYYPFASHLAFWVGDLNTGLYMNSVDSWDHGYLAEARHLSLMRGYDNVRRTGEGRPLQVDLHSPAYRYAPWLPACDTVVRGVQLRDYSSILPFVKAGPGSGLLRQFNEGRAVLAPKDVQLTVDAVLQTRLQQKMAEWQSRYHKNRYASIERRSVVVMSGQGDVLASAVYPLPEQDRMAAGQGIYNDCGKAETWSAWTDTDLGMVYATAPGSTAKVMSALAAVDWADQKGLSLRDSRFSYHIHKDEQIHPSSRTVGRVGLHDAVLHSSNAYFILLVNDLDLYGRLAYIYGHAGISTGSSGMPYRLMYRTPQESWLGRVTAMASGATKRYRDYIDKRMQGGFRKLNDWHISHPAWQWAWGQGMDATPLAVARMTAAVTDGRMPVTRFRMDVRPESVHMADNGRNLSYLRQAMRDEALKLGSRTRLAKAGVMGKSGTAERVYQGSLYKEGTVQTKVNDAWYTCIVPDCRLTKVMNGQQVVTEGPVAVTVRIERTSAMSGVAKLLTEEVVMPVLAELGYIPAWQ